MLSLSQRGYKHKLLSVWECIHIIPMCYNLLYTEIVERWKNGQISQWPFKERQLITQWSPRFVNDLSMIVQWPPWLPRSPQRFDSFPREAMNAQQMLNKRSRSADRSHRWLTVYQRSLTAREWGCVKSFNPLAAPSFKGVIAWTEIYHLLQKNHVQQFY